MNWLPIATGAALFNALMDLFVKLASTRINSALGVVIINTFSAITAFLWLLWLKTSGEVFQFSKLGFAYSALAGISIGIASILFIKTFATGVNLSVGAPFVRVGMITLASILGILFLKENFTIRYLLGFLLSMIGLYLIVVK